MKLKTIKTEAEVREAVDSYPDELPHVAATVRDGSIVEVRVGTMVITSTYGMTVAKMTVYEEAERYRVRVEHPAFPVINRYFDSEYPEAREFQKQYADIPDAVIDARTVKVQLNDAGNVVAEIDDEGTVRPLGPQRSEKGEGGDDIPF
jgi:hypothetical protein